MLKTEERNEKSTHIDRMTTENMVAVMQEANLEAAKAVGEVESAIGKAIDGVYAGMKEGGRLFYIGCGTSGRLGVQDAAEVSVTFGVPFETVVGIIAGGDQAIRRPVERVEDDGEAGQRDLEAYTLTEKDSVIGVSAAGGAEYVLGALRYARKVGAFTVGLTSNEGSPLDAFADVGIHPNTGAEIITGSTRMKAGTAQKMILNMISTGVMVKLGCVYENMMINIKPVNVKLRARMIRILSQILSVPQEKAENLLEQNGWNIPAAAKKYEESV